MPTFVYLTQVAKYMRSRPLGIRQSPDRASSKSKQERIRDNQRRSRARRQEYLADLERRLSECQLTCREADIQRAAFLELQIENTRLKELLALAGVNEQFVEHFVSQAVAQVTTLPQEGNPAFRQLKPKIPPVDAAKNLSNSGLQAPLPRHNIRAATSQPSRSPSTVVPERSVSTTPQSAPASTYTPTHGFPISPMMQQDPSAFEWYYQQQHVPYTSKARRSPHLSNNYQQAQPYESWHCDVFDTASTGPPRVADEGSVLCSVAKQMIDQYSLPPAEMEMVKSRLAQGFCSPAYPGAGCAVDNQSLFQVLNELSARYS